MFPYTKEQILEESAEDFDAFSEELKGLFLVGNELETYISRNLRMKPGAISGWEIFASN